MAARQELCYPTGEIDARMKEKQEVVERKAIRIAALGLHLQKCKGTEDRKQQGPNRQYLFGPCCMNSVKQLSGLAPAGTPLPRVTPMPCLLHAPVPAFGQSVQDRCPADAATDRRLPSACFGPDPIVDKHPKFSTIRDRGPGSRACCISFMVNYSSVPVGQKQFSLHSGS